MLENGHTLLQGARKLLLFAAYGRLDGRLPLAQLGVGGAHLLHQRGQQAVKKQPRGAELAAVANGPAHDPAQHVGAAFVAGQHAVGDQEGAGADVIGNDAQRGRAAVFDPQQLRRGLDQRLKQVDLVIAVHALQHRGNALQAHARVHGGFGQGRHTPLGVALELHKDQIPDLDIAIEIVARHARRGARHPGAVVIEHLRAGPAGAGIAHLPEVVLIQARDTCGGETDVIGPNPLGLVVVAVHRDPQPLPGQFQVAGEELPGEANGLSLEVVAKAEVAEHFEEGVVARGVADIFQIVVLAAGAHTALRAGCAGTGPWLQAQKHVLELVHTGVGEQQRGIVRGDQRTAGDASVLLRCKVSEESLANVEGFHSGEKNIPWSLRRPWARRGSAFRSARRR